MLHEHRKQRQPKVTEAGQSMVLDTCVTPAGAFIDIIVAQRRLSLQFVASEEFLNFTAP